MTTRRGTAGTRRRKRKPRTDTPAGVLRRIDQQGKRLRGAQLLVWRRIEELVAAGLAADEAKRQATAELAKGVLSNGCCVVIDVQRRNRKKGVR